MIRVNCIHGLSSSEYCRLCKELSEKTLYGNPVELEEEETTEFENISSDTTPAKSTQTQQLEVPEDPRVKEVELRQREEAVVKREVDAEKEKQKLRLWQEELIQKENKVLKMDLELEEKSIGLNKKEQRIKQQFRVLKADLRERDKQIEVQGTTINSQKRQLQRRAKQIEELRVLATQVSNFAITDKLIRDWLTEYSAPSNLGFPSSLVTLGSSPFLGKDFDQFLANKDYKLYQFNEEAEIMVVGRTDWTEEELEKQIGLREGNTLKIYSQEMFIAALATGRDPFETADEETLLAFGRGHQALEYLMEAEIKWPSAEVPAGEDLDPKTIMEGLSEESPLHSMGYSVGVSGPGVRKRLRILAEAFEGDLPRVGSNEYMDEWGNPNTRRRLWRIAHHIAWLVRFRKSNRSMSHAVNHWESDLAWLAKRYYTPRMRFTWPSTMV